MINTLYLPTHTLRYTEIAHLHKVPMRNFCYPSTSSGQAQDAELSTSATFSPKLKRTRSLGTAEVRGKMWRYSNPMRASQGNEKCTGQAVPNISDQKPFEGYLTQSSYKTHQVIRENGQNK